MKIIQLVTRRQRRGAEVFATQLGDGLVERGHEVVILGLYSPTTDPLAPSLAQVADLRTASRSPLSWSRVRELSAVIESLEPDLVQANGSDTLKYSSLAKWVGRASWPLLYRNISIASQWLRYPGHNLLGRFLLRRVDYVISVSEESRADYSATFGVPSTRIGTIPIGTDIPVSLERAGTRERLLQVAGIPSDARVLMHVGSFTPEKNHFWLLQVFAAVRRREPRAHLILVGDGPLRRRARQAAEEAGLVEAVTMLGTRPDAAELVAGADVFVLPSTIEGLPGVILEASANGVPSVATDVGSIRDVINDGNTGAVVAVGDLEAFTGAILDLLGDDARRKEMGLAAREKVRNQYDMARIIDAFEDLYWRIARERSCAAVPSTFRSSRKSL